MIKLDGRWINPRAVVRIESHAYNPDACSIWLLDHLVVSVDLPADEAAARVSGALEA